MKFPVLLGFCCLLAAAAQAEFSFDLIDNFEGGGANRWYEFDKLQKTVVKNASVEARDVVAEGCGDFSLELKGVSTNWYAGGIGTDLNADMTGFSRLQMDIYGGRGGGRIKIELFDDDNRNSVLEQDPARDWKATKDDKWVAEIPILGAGWTRISVPFSAFRLENPGCGDGVWNPDHKDNSGGLLKMQLILLTEGQSGEVEAKIDNIILTF